MIKEKGKKKLDKERKRRDKRENKEKKELCQFILTDEHTEKKENVRTRMFQHYILINLIVVHIVPLIGK